MQAITTYLNTRRIGWVLFATLLVFLGFLIDASSAFGHHALLISGGALAGWKLKP